MKNILFSCIIINGVLLGYLGNAKIFLKKNHLLDLRKYKYENVSLSFNRRHYLAQDNVQNISSSHILAQLGKYILAKENRSLATMAVFLTATNIGLNFLSPYLLSQAIQLISNHQQDSQLLVVMCLLSYATSKIILNIRDQLLVPVTINTAQNILQDIVEHILRRSLQEHINTPESDKIYLIQKGLPIGNLGTILIAQIIPPVLEMVIICIWVSKKHESILGIAPIFLVILNTLSGVWFSNSIIHSRDELIKYGSKAWEQFIGVVTKYKSMHDFCRLDKTLSEVNVLLNNMKKADIKANNLNLRVGLVQHIISSIGIIFLCLYLSRTVRSGKYKFSDFVFTINYLIHLSNNFPLFNQAINQFIAAYPDVSFVFRELARPHEVFDLYPNNYLNASSNRGLSIEFENVDFSYPMPGNKTKVITVLNNVSFKIDANQRAAFVSESGAGKTTIFNSIYRYYSPTRGIIRINGLDISLLSINSLRKQFGLFEQSTNLFKGTVRSNICYGMHNSELITDDKIMEMADLVDLKDFIRNLPNQLDTCIDDVGKSLSGGQLQKIAILRGLFKQNLSLLLFDEVTASLDGDSARKILQRILYNLNRVTMLMISHKLYEIKDVDKIIVLEKGSVVAEGTHSQLLKTCSVYRRLWHANTESDSKFLNNLSFRRRKISDVFNPPVPQYIGKKMKVFQYSTINGIFI